MRTLRLAGVSAVLMSALVLAGCSGQPDNKVASLGGDKDKVAAQNDADVPKDPKERALKFAKCMREQGIDMPDPGADGSVRAMPMDKDQKKMEEAFKKCSPDGKGGIVSLRPGGEK